MTDNASPLLTPAQASDGWSKPSGDLLIPVGDLIGIRFRQEHLGGPFSAIMFDVPSGIRASFKLVDASVVSCQDEEASIGVPDPSGLRFGQWIDFGALLIGHVSLAVMCIGRPRRGDARTRSAGADCRRLRGILWLRDGSGRLWGETVGWVGHRAADDFSAWCSR